MKVITEEFCAALSTMAIEDCEELNFVRRLFCTRWLNTRLLQIKHYRNSVLIVISNQSIMCICSVGHHIRCLCFLRYFCLLDNRPYWNKAKIVTSQLLVDFCPHRRKSRWCHWIRRQLGLSIWKKRAICSLWLWYVKITLWCWHSVAIAWWLFNWLWRLDVLRWASCWHTRWTWMVIKILLRQGSRLFWITRPKICELFDEVVVFEHKIGCTRLFLIIWASILNPSTINTCLRKLDRFLKRIRSLFLIWIA